MSEGEVHRGRPRSTHIDEMLELHALALVPVLVQIIAHFNDQR